MYTIGAFSRLAQIPVKTLRYYDAIGLLRPAEVEPRTGYRRYDAAQLERLNRILVLKDMGLPLLEIKDLLAEHLSLDTMREIVALLRVDLEQRAARERARLARAAARLDVMESGQGAGSHEIAIRATAPRWVASLRRQVPSHGHCVELFDELRRLTGATGRGPAMTGAIWHACADGAVDCEVLEFLPAPIEAKGPARVYQLPAERVAALIYRGESEYRGAYVAMRTWLAATRARTSGPKRELFLRESGADSLTEIQFPIAS